MFTAGVKGASVNVDLAISDVVSDLDGALTFYTDGSNGTWGCWGSYEYMRLTDDPVKQFSATDIGPGLLVEGSFKSEVTILDGGLTYKLSEAVSLLAGVRHWNIDNKISAEASIADTTLRDVKVSGSQGITDGFIGARIRVPFSERWSGTFRFDVGQGDSEFSRQAMAMANYHITDRWTSSIGYRNLSVDYKDGDFMFDMANEGVQVALLYQL